MVNARGDIVWVDFGAPRGSPPAKVRPAIVFQDDWLLATDIRTVLTVPLTTNTALEAFPGNVLVPAESSGSPKTRSLWRHSSALSAASFSTPPPPGTSRPTAMKQVTAGVRLVTGI